MVGPIDLCCNKRPAGDFLIPSLAWEQYEWGLPKKRISCTSRIVDLRVQCTQYAIYCWLPRIFWAKIGDISLEKKMATHVQYSCLENPMDRWDWGATVHGVIKNQTWLSMPPHTQEIYKYNKCLMWSLVGQSDSLCILAVYLGASAKHTLHLK